MDISEEKLFEAARDITVGLVRGFNTSNRDECMNIINSSTAMELGDFMFVLYKSLEKHFNSHYSR